MSDAFAQQARTVLPISNVVEAGLTIYDAMEPDSVFPSAEKTNLPDGAQNLIVTRIDDCCHGTSSGCGSLSRGRFLSQVQLAPTELGVGRDIASIANTEYTDA